MRWSADKLMKEPVIFGDFVDMPGDSSQSRVYKPITDMKKLAQSLEEYYMRQNIGNTQVSWLITLLKHGCDNLKLSNLDYEKFR